MPRRSFLLVVLAGVAAVLMFFAFRFQACLWPFIFRPKKGPSLSPRPNPFREGEKRVASIVHGGDVEKVVRSAIDLIGGIGKLDVLGKSVLLKPNILSSAPPPVTTNPNVIKAVTKILYESGAKRVLVGDMSAFFKLPTRKNMETTFIKTASEEVEAELVPFDERGWVSVETPQGEFVKRVYVAEALFQVDRIINIPVIKTHGSATYSIALKNFVGATHFRQRPYLINRDHWEEVIAELNLAWAPDLHVVDGTRIMVEGGPWGGKAVEGNLVIATGDRILADLLGLGVLKHFSELPQIRDVDPWEQRQVKRAMELGLGIKRGDEIELLEMDLEPSIPGFKGVVETVRKAVLKEKVEAES